MSTVSGVVIKGERKTKMFYLIDCRLKIMVIVY